MTFRQYINQLLAQNKIERVLDILIGATEKSEPESQNSFILLKSQFLQLNQEALIMPGNELMRQKARIFAGIQGAIGQLSDHILETPIADDDVGGLSGLDSKPDVAPKRLITKHVRRMIMNGLSDDDFKVLCMDDFLEVYNSFAAGQDRLQQVNNLLEYVLKRGLEPVLLNSLKDMNPVMYLRNEPYWS